MNAASPGRRGTLILVVGPSGAGKDTLIAYCREHLAGDDRVVFPRRVATRQVPHPGEDHASATLPDFDAAVAVGGFALHWSAHGISYGIPAAIEADLEDGRTVVVNVSRGIVADARRRFRPIRVVAVAAPRAVLAARLAARGRESPDEIAGRLDRSMDLATADGDLATIDNAGAVETAGEALLALIKAEARIG